MKQAICTLALCAGSVFAGEVFYQGFETDTAGWLDESNGWAGTVTRVSSGTLGITSASGSNHAHFAQSYSDNAGGVTGGFTRFDGYRDSAWSGPYQASVDIYLDTGWGTNEGFDYSVASSTSAGGHLRDFIFHVTKDMSGNILIGGSNNTNFDPQLNLADGNHASISDSGWYTFEHSFYEAADGSLEVALNLYNSSGTLLFTEIRNNPADLVGSIAGGNRYGWFTNIDIANGINVDNVTLNVVPLPPAAFAGLGMLGIFGGIRQLRKR